MTLYEFEKLTKSLIELNTEIVKIKAENESLKRENEFLKSLLLKTDKP
jgi:hypothetical protein